MREKPKYIAQLSIEGGVTHETGFSAILSSDAPWVAALWGHHSVKYTERLGDLPFAFTGRFGRRSESTYEERAFRYRHLNMAAALEEEAETRHKLRPNEGPREGSQIWGDGDVWTRPTEISNFYDDANSYGDANLSQIWGDGDGNANSYFAKYLQVHVPLRRKTGRERTTRLRAVFAPIGRPVIAFGFFFSGVCAKGERMLEIAPCDEITRFALVNPRPT